MKPRYFNPLVSRIVRTGFASLIIVCGLPLSAQSISVNFGANQSSSTIDDATKTSGAIPVAGNFWNNTTVNGGGSLTSLLDSTGATTSAAVTWTANNTYLSGSTGATATSQNGFLTKGYLDDGGTGWTVNLTSPYLLSDIYIIHATDQAVSATTMSAVSVNGIFYKGNGAGGTVAASGSADSWAAAPWSAADTLVESTNYIKVTGQIDVNLAGLNSSPGRAAIAGLQVVNGYTGTMLYWDPNGATAGAGENLDGTWGTSNFWSPSSAGDATTTGWTPGAAAVFSAGTDGIASSAVAVTGTQAADAIWVQEGGVTLNGGTINLSAGLGLLRGDDQGLVVNSAVNANNLSTVGQVTLDGTNTVTGLATINGTTVLGTNTTFPRLAGSGILDFGNTTLSVGNGTDSTFGGSLVGGGKLMKLGTGTLTLGKTSESFNGAATLSAGTVKFDAAGSLWWHIEGPGAIAKAGAGILAVRSNITTTGVLDIQAGTFQIGDSSQDGSLSGQSSIALAAGAILSNRTTVNDTTISSNISLAGPTSQIRQQGVLATDSLTLSGVVGASTANGVLRSAMGRLSLAAGANVTVNTVSGQGATATPGVINVGTGASLTAAYLNIGDGGGTSGIVNVNGGTLTIPVLSSGANEGRFGHWDNTNAVTGSQLNVTAGTYDASGANIRTNIGWDGLAFLTVGGGSTPAVLKAWRLEMDANGNNATYNCIGTLSTNGSIEIGAGGALASSINDYLVLSGGTITGTASSTWTARLDAANPSVIGAASGATITHTGQLSGAANLTKTGEGTLRLGNTSTTAPNTFAGTLATTAGTTELAGPVAGGSLSVSGTGVLYLGAASTSAAVTASAGGVVALGSAAIPGTGTAATGAFTLAGGALKFSVGSSGGQITAPAFSVASASTLRYLPASAITAPASLTLVDYEGTIGGLGAAGITLESLNPHFVGTLQDDTANTQLKLNITSSDSVVWKGNVSGSWDVNTTANWGLSSNTATSSKYYDYDAVRFDDTGIAVPTVTLTGTIIPAVIEVANTTGTYTFQGAAVTGTTGLAKSGAGGLTLVNTFGGSGAVTVSGGTLTIGAGGTTGAITGTLAGTVDAGASLDFNRSDAATFSRPMTGAGTVHKKGANTLNISSAGSTILPTNVVVETGTLQLSVGSFSGNRMTGAGSLTIAPGATLLISSAHGLGGDNNGMNEALNINGKLTLNAEQYISTMTLNAATIDGTNEIRVPAGTVNYTVSGTAPSTVSARIGQGFSNGTWTVNDVTASSAADLTISGIMTGTFGPIKAGAGTLVSTGVNTYTGPTTVSAGVLQFGDGGTTGAIGTGAVTTNATLSFKRSDAVTVAAAIGGTGTVSQDGTGVLTLSGLSTYTGDTVVNSGTLNLADNAQLKFVIGANGVSNKITGTGAVELLGDFNLDLTGAAVASGNSWTLVAPSLTRTFLSNFTLVGFTEITPGIHTMVVGTNTWTFSEVSGVLTVTSAAGDYTTWLSGFSFPAGADTSPTGDPDGDGVNNQAEYAFGLNPTSGASVSPITAPLSQATGTFKYTRRASSGLTYKILTSTTLGSWTQDTGAVQTAGPTDASGNQEVTVTLTGAPLSASKLFIRVSAN